MDFQNAWRSFERGKWSNDEVDVRDFIQRNYIPYEGDASFLAPATEATKALWACSDSAPLLFMLL